MQKNNDTFEQRLQDSMQSITVPERLSPEEVALTLKQLPPKIKISKKAFSLIAAAAAVAICVGVWYGTGFFGSRHNSLEAPAAFDSKSSLFAPEENSSEIISDTANGASNFDEAKSDAASAENPMLSGTGYEGNCRCAPKCPCGTDKCTCDFLCPVCHKCTSQCICGGTCSCAEQHKDNPD